IDSAAREEGRAVIPFRCLSVSVVLGMAVLSGCESLPGQPKKGSEPLAPSEVRDFYVLYSENCAGCHGVEGRGGIAIALANPVYLAIADEAAVRNPIAN